MKFERMLAIVMLLLQRKQITGKELAEMFEVSLRTIYRDIEAISAAGIPIVTASGIGGGIGIMEQYKIEKGIFTADDISTMLMGLGIAHNALSGKDITKVHAKLKSFIPEEFADDVASKTDQIMFDLSSWIREKDSNRVLDAVKTAMEQNQTLSFFYLGRRGQESLTGIEPHRLVFKNSQWYLQGYVNEKQDFRLFKLRRMYHVQMEIKFFERRSLLHPFSDFTDEMSRKTFKIKLLLDNSAVDKMLDYCTIDDITEIGNGKFLVEFNFIDDDYGYGILMSFGNKLTCVEPDFVRKELQRRLEVMLAQYTL
jgi:predicted DNA-binding transcriptional regulator YafY